MASGPRSGPIAALKRIAITGLSMGQARLQLIGNELQTEKHRALGQLVRALMAVFCGALALVLMVGLVLVLLWDQRAAVLAVLIVVLLGIAVALLRSVKQELATQEHPFAATLAELQEDLRQLKAASSDVPPQEPR